MKRLLLFLVMLLTCMQVFALTDYPADCDTHLVKPTTNHPKILTFKIPQVDLQGKPPQQGSFVIASIYVQNLPASKPNIVRSDMIMDNYIRSSDTRAASNNSTDFLGKSITFDFFEDAVQPDSAYLHFTFTKVDNDESLNPVVGVMVCTMKH